MKCFRFLYKPDNTAFMAYGNSMDEAFERVSKRNYDDLDEERTQAFNRENYLCDEFTPETNGNGVLVFYDIYNTFPRKIKEK